MFAISFHKIKIAYDHDMTYQSLKNGSLSESKGMLCTINDLVSYNIPEEFSLLNYRRFRGS
jgi:hypothetical protein